MTSTTNTTNKPLRRVGTLTLGVSLIAAGVLFLLCILNDFTEVHVCLVAQADEHTDAEVIQLGRTQCRQKVGTGLRNQGNRSLVRQIRYETAVIVVIRSSDTYQVRSDQRQSILSAILGNLVLQVLISDFSESGGRNHGDFHLLLHTLFQSFENTRCRKGNKCQIHVIRNIQDGFVCR